MQLRSFVSLMVFGWSAGTAGAAEARVTVDDRTGSCPGRPGFQPQLHEIIEASLADGALRIQVILEDGRQVSGELSLYLGDQRVFVRRVSGASCAEVEDALSLALQVHLDELEDHLPEDQPQLSPSVRRSVVSARSAGTLAGIAPEPPQLEWPEMENPEARKPRTRRWANVRAGVIMATSTLPEPAYGFGLAGQARIIRRLVTTFEVSHLGSVGFPGARKGNASFTSVFWGLGAQLDWSSAWAWVVDAGPYVGWVHTSLEEEGLDPTGERMSFRGSHVNAGIQAHGDLVYRLPADWLLDFRFGWGAALVRARFVSQDDRLLWQQPFGMLQGGIFLGRVFP